MGAYASVNDVKSEFKNLTISTDTPITTSEVNSFIDQEEAYVNSRLSGLYEIPITGTESLKIMKMITVWCVADRIREIMQVKNISEPKVQQGTRAGGSCKRAREILKELRSRDTVLEDAVFKSTDGGFDSFTVQQGLENKFKKNVDQW